MGQFPRDASRKIDNKRPLQALAAWVVEKVTCPSSLLCDVGQPRGDRPEQFIGFRQPTYAFGTTRLPSRCRLDDFKPVTGKLGKIPLRGRLVPHYLIHRRRQQNGLPLQIDR